MDPEQRMIDAVRSGDLAAVCDLLDADPRLVIARGENGVSAILLATYFGRDDIVEVLLSREPRVDIFEASAVGELSRVKELVESDAASVNSYSADGFTPLGFAAFFGHKDVLDLLLAHGADPNAASKNQMRVAPIHSAVAHRDPDTALAMAESLLRSGSEVNVAQHGGWTPLHQAAAHGNVEIIKLLISHGAVAAANDDGKTPVDMAQEKAYTEAAEIILGRSDAG